MKNRIARVIEEKEGGLFERCSTKDIKELDVGTIIKTK
jgi:hypothetical protein